MKSFFISTALMFSLSAMAADDSRVEYYSNEGKKQSGEVECWIDFVDGSHKILYIPAENNADKAVAIITTIKRLGLFPVDVEAVSCGQGLVIAPGL